MRLTTWLRWIALASFLAMFVTYVAVIFVMPFASWADWFVGSAFAVFVSSLLALPCAACRARGRWRRLMASGVVAFAISGAGWLVLIVLENSQGVLDVALLAKAVLPVFVWASVCAVVAVLYMHRTTNIVAIWLRRLSLATTALLAVSIVLAIWFDDAIEPYDHEVARTIGALSLLMCCGIVGTLIVIRLRHLEIDEGDESEEEAGEHLDIRLTCPRCNRRQLLPTGGAPCVACGLRIRIAVP